MPFTITAMRSADAAAIREDVAAGRREGRRVVDAEGAPCRHCLRPARAGEAMLLVTYQPFTGEGPYAVPSPVFVHERPCVRHDPNAVAPLLYDGPRAVRSYTEDHDLLEGEVVEGAALDEVIERLLGDDRAAYLHVHSATAGCFTCRVDRTSVLGRSLRLSARQIARERGAGWAAGVSPPVGWVGAGVGVVGVG